MAAGGNFEKNQSWVLIWNGEKCKGKLISDIQNENESCILNWNCEKCKWKLAI